MPLHLDYRPADFDEVVGNAETVKSIQAILGREGKDWPHAWMFTGPKGCGKTTLARIVTGKLGCKETSQDFNELDIAQLTGIDTARQIRTAMRYKPVESGCRVWLLDEVHRSSKAFQDGMLKALEDTPGHVYFLLCTTDPKKLLPTLRSRCTPFEVGTLSDREMARLINEVAEPEGVELTEPALNALIENAAGTPREALVMLDKVMDLTPEEMVQTIQRGLVDEKQIIDLCRSLIKKEGWPATAQILKGLKNEDPENVRLAVNGYMTSVMLNGKQLNSQALRVLHCFREPNHYNGRAGLVLACASVYQNL